MQCNVIYVCLLIRNYIPIYIYIHIYILEYNVMQCNVIYAQHTDLRTKKILQDNAIQSMCAWWLKTRKKYCTEELSAELTGHDMSTDIAKGATL